MTPERIDVGWIDPDRVHGNFAQNMAVQIRDMEYHGCMGKPFRASAPQPNEARNNLVNQFLTESDSPWFWMVDTDQVFDKGHVMKLWTVANEYGADMVTGLVFIFKEGNQPVPSLFYTHPETGEYWQGADYIPDGPSEVAACGLGSVLVHRKVFEVMQYARHPKRRWFDSLDVTPNDNLDGTDVQFFHRARELGYTLFVEPAAEAWSIEEIGVGRADFERYHELRAGVSDAKEE